MKRKDGFTGERAIVLPPLVVEMEQEDPLVSSLYVTDIGYYPHAANHYRERKEPIGQYVLIFCAEGAGWYRVGGQEFRVRDNQYFILPAGKPHAYASEEDNPWTIYWVHFSGTQADIYAEGVMRPQDARPGEHSRISDRNRIFEEIFNTLDKSRNRESLRYVSSLLHYYLASMRYIMQFRTASAATGDGSIVTAAIRYMGENIEKQLSLKEIAAYAGYSPTHFSALFKRQTGDSPLAHFNKLKVRQACRMLEQTDMKVNQICHKVGITDCYYFSRLFSKAMGMPPQKYRELHRDGPHGS